MLTTKALYKLTYLATFLSAILENRSGSHEGDVVNRPRHSSWEGKDSSTSLPRPWFTNKFRRCFWTQIMVPVRVYCLRSSICLRCLWAILLVSAHVACAVPQGWRKPMHPRELQKGFMALPFLGLRSSESSTGKRRVIQGGPAAPGTAFLEPCNERELLCDMFFPSSVCQSRDQAQPYLCAVDGCRRPAELSLSTGVFILSAWNPVSWGGAGELLDLPRRMAGIADQGD